jgi:hypothetical protein
MFTGSVYHLCRENFSHLFSYPTCFLPLLLVVIFLQLENKLSVFTSEVQLE